MRAPSSSALWLILSVAMLLGPSLGLPGGGALAEGRRVALVVGVSAYGAAPPVPGADADAAAVAGMFRAAAFDSVALVADPKAGELRAALDAFARTARDADAAVLYYAGHGAEVGGTAYMIPADVGLARPEDLAGAIDLDAGARTLRGVRGVALLLYDAARADPFAPSRRRAAPREPASPQPADAEPAPQNLLIGYAARARGTPERGADGGPFAAALVANLTVPGLDLRLAFGRIRDAVLGATGGRQEPFLYGSLGSGTAALVPAGRGAPR